MTEEKNQNNQGRDFRQHSTRNDDGEQNRRFGSGNGQRGGYRGGGRGGGGDRGGITGIYRGGGGQAAGLGFRVQEGGLDTGDNSRFEDGAPGHRGATDDSVDHRAHEGGDGPRRGGYHREGGRGRGRFQDPERQDGGWNGSARGGRGGRGGDGARAPYDNRFDRGERQQYPVETQGQDHGANRSESNADGNDRFNAPSQARRNDFPPRSRARPPADMDLKPLRYEERDVEAAAARPGRTYQLPHQPREEVQQPAGPQRTQRAPRLRRNNFDEREVEELFQTRHNQRGISFDNYESIAVEIVPNDVEAVTTFVGLNIHPLLNENIKRCGYEKPTPVQKYGIPVCLKGKDLMACAQTGSGKTAAFLVPVVNHILEKGVSPADRRVSFPIALVMAPTRELALQIYDESRKLVFKTDIFCDVVYGGTSYPHHFEQDILVACPGRLKDIFDREQVSFSKTKFLILDEADRMLEMGFEEQIEYLVGSAYSDMPPPEQRQTLMFSATFPVPIRNLAQKYLRRQYYLLTVGRVGSTTRNIKQKIIWADDAEKQDKLMELLYQQNQTDLVLIFVETKRSAEDLYALLYDAGIPTSTIHGDRKQFEREEALKRFKDGRTPILVATDVASRGLDIPNVAHVIQYDLPRAMDDYTHRIGRTARAGNEGNATAFFNNGNNGLTEELLAYLQEHDQEVPEWMETMKDEREMQHFVSSSNRGGPRRGGRGGGRGGRGGRFDDAPSTWDDEPRPARRGGRGGGSDAPKAQPKKATAPKSYVADGGF